MQSKIISPIYLFIPVVLAIPLIAMQFTDEVSWGPGDFLIMGGMLFIAFLFIDLVNRRSVPGGLKFALTLILIFGLGLVWAELAVGLFGTPFAGD